MSRPAPPGTVAFLTIAATLLLPACARRSEFIGAVTDAGAPGDAPADVDAPAETDASDADPIAALCQAADSPAPAISEPTWNCPGIPRCFSDPAITPAAFTTATSITTGAPVLIYPLPGSVHPVNLPGVTLQWTRPPGEGQKSFHISIKSTSKPTTNTYDFYVPYQAPAGPLPPSPPEFSVFPVPERFWRWIGSQNAGSEVQITVAGFDPASNQVATSAPIAIRFSATAVEGGLFYLATEPNRTIWRQLFGSGGGPQELVPIPVAGQPGLDCAGCHSVSRDGRRIAFAATYAGDLTLASTLDVSQPTLKPTKPGPDLSDAVAPALSPNGQFVFARNGIDNGVSLRDGSSGVEIETKPAAEMGGRIDFPEWSPTGLEIVATRAVGAQQPMQVHAANDGQLVILSIDPAAPRGSRIGKPDVIATADAAHTYGNPSFSPDGKWIVVVSRPAGTSSYHNAVTRLRLIDRTQPSNVYELGQATRSGDSAFADSASTYPKFAPTAQNNCKTFFVTFQSRMDYGLVRVASLTGEREWPQLWMTAIDLTRLPNADPSSPPLWLPFQDIHNKNLLPSWSARMACDDRTPCGPGATCSPQQICVVVPNSN